jgi:4,5-dihydroxyphthalate decarboxylase
MKRTLKTAFWNYDRTIPLVNGRVEMKDFEFAAELLNPDEIFARAFGSVEFDVCELSFSRSVTAASLGKLPYAIIPVFLSRAFRHSALFVRADASITGPQDLKGRSIGVYDYAMTGALVVRGLLRGYGVQPSDLYWKIGEGGEVKNPGFPGGRAPEGLDIQVLPPGRTLEDRLLAGELDAIISLNVPAAAKLPGSPLRRLFADPTAAERAWFEKTRIFPIMHAVGVRKSLVAQHPELVMQVYQAFSQAKDVAVAELEIVQAPKVTLPWPHIALSEARALMGPDCWPYGISANRHALDAQLQWSFEDGLQAKRIVVEDLFAPECKDT